MEAKLDILVHKIYQILLKLKVSGIYGKITYLEYCWWFWEQILGALLGALMTLPQVIFPIFGKLMGW